MAEKTGRQCGAKQHPGGITDGDWKRALCRLAVLATKAAQRNSALDFTAEVAERTPQLAPLPVTATCTGPRCRDLSRLKRHGWQRAAGTLPLGRFGSEGIALRTTKASQRNSARGCTAEVAKRTLQQAPSQLTTTTVSPSDGSYIVVEWFILYRRRYWHDQARMRLMSLVSSTDV